MGNKEVIQAVQQKLFGKKDQEENLVRAIYSVMKAFGYTLEEVNNLPITTFLVLLNLMEKENKEIERKIERGKKHR